MKATAVPTLAERAVQFYGDEAAVFEQVATGDKRGEDNTAGGKNSDVKGGGDASVVQSKNTNKSIKDGRDEKIENVEKK